MKEKSFEEKLKFDQIKIFNLIENKLLEMSSNKTEGEHKKINSWLLHYPLGFVMELL